MCSFAIVFLSPNAHVRYQLTGTFRFYCQFIDDSENGQALKIRTAFLWPKQIRTLLSHTVLQFYRGEIGTQTKMREEKKKTKTEKKLKLKRQNMFSTSVTPFAQRRLRKRQNTPNFVGRNEENSESVSVNVWTKHLSDVM